MIFGMSLLFVFLILAAQYESWTLPFSVLLGTPIAVFGAFVGSWLDARLENNVYAQIGLVMLIGLAAKNAILIVEFAKMEYRQRQVCRRRRADRGKTPPAADPDDGIRLHPRMRAAVDGLRRRRDIAAVLGNMCDRRHARRFLPCNLPDSRQLRGCRANCSSAQGSGISSCACRRANGRGLDDMGRRYHSAVILLLLSQRMHTWSQVQASRSNSS